MVGEEQTKRTDEVVCLSSISAHVRCEEESLQHLSALSMIQGGKVVLLSSLQDLSVRLALSAELLVIEGASGIELLLPRAAITEARWTRDLFKGEHYIEVLFHKARLLLFPKVENLAFEQELFRI